MRVVDRFMNGKEALVLRELEGIAKDNGMRVFAKPRMSDVLARTGRYFTPSEFSLYTQSHFDFLLVDEATRPVMAIEYDGPRHLEPMQIERDAIKNALCREAGFGLLRIQDHHFDRLYRGMTVLRWIVEVTELKRAFYEAQAAGSVPPDEPFDPANFMTMTGWHDFPYWLSADANVAINKFLSRLDPSGPKGWHSFTGSDGPDVSLRLSTIYFEDQVLWRKTAIREQDLDFPTYDLLNEINGCRLGETLKLYQQGELTASSIDKFRPVWDEFRERYRARPSSSSGAFPIYSTWKGSGIFG
ncbi:DUF2726 domain-containing protein [Brevundimonas aurantiaca]|jgi:very-short-patch-repair endonuclease|uniref:DUF2726 domain-containing protein n=1 Tax=Brevundimonas aurantiaca TaxID=74316 RepID=UPI001D1821AE|nr:DUF2726 domain-containing protein [Brevundimonas aurantiaca]MCC4292786.1 DUF2726 domain-containing protein [Brevundimonas aurantiaca]